MRILIDTHVLLWMGLQPERLGEAARRRIEDVNTRLVLSAASAWEIGVKFKLGKLSLPVEPAEWLGRAVQVASLEELPVTRAHALEAANLPLHHRDPFDRMLIAQARLEQLPLLTSDTRLRAYQVDLLPA